jgi:hypothetical protein
MSVLDRRVIRTLRLNEQDRHEGAADLDFVQAARRDQRIRLSRQPLLSLSSTRNGWSMPTHSAAEPSRCSEISGRIPHEKAAILPNVQLAQGDSLSWNRFREVTKV